MITPDERLRDLFGDSYSIKTHPVGKAGYISNFLDSNGIQIGTGFRNNPQDSINVAISEAVERDTVRKIKAPNHYLTNIFPTTCGFAAGLNPQKTKIRSLMEAVERWALSKWIDEKFYIPIYQIEINEYSDFMSRLENDFETVMRFKKALHIHFDNKLININIGITVAFQKNGAYLGIRASNSQDIWEHGLSEAWAAMLFAKNKITTSCSYDANNFILDQRVLFFSNNSLKAIEQIPTTEHFSWPQPEILYHSEIHESPKPFVIYRTILKDYQNWETGPIDRFVY